MCQVGLFGNSIHVLATFLPPITRPPQWQSGTNSNHGIPTAPKVPFGMLKKIVSAVNMKLSIVCPVVQFSERVGPYI